MTTPTERANAAFPGDDPTRSISILTARQLGAVMIGEAVREAQQDRDAATREVGALRFNPARKIFDHKWLDPECVETGCQSLTLRGNAEALRQEVGRLQALVNVMNAAAGQLRADTFPCPVCGLTTNLIGRCASADCPSTEARLQQFRSNLERAPDANTGRPTYPDPGWSLEDAGAPSAADVERAREIVIGHRYHNSDDTIAAVAAALTAARVRGRAAMREIPYQNLLTAIGVACRCGPGPAKITISVQAFHDELAKHGFVIRALPDAAQKDHQK